MADPVRLLLVEDSEADAELVCLELEKGGLELSWRRVENEPDFVAALDQEWDVIVSDFKMDGFDGLRAFAVYKERGIEVPFIFVSGALGEERAVEAMRAGAMDYLLKDNLARLSVAVRRELSAAGQRAARRDADEATRREQRRLALAVEASGAGVFEHRVPLARDTYCSARWAEILGYTVEELPPHQDLEAWVSRRIEPDDLSVARAAYGDFVSGRSDELNVELRVQHRDGHWLDVSVLAKAVERDAQGRAAHVVGVLLDVSDSRKLEAQLRQAQKMQAIGRLAGGVAHDFNNLLSVILTAGQFALNAAQEGGSVHDDVQEILSAAKKAGELTSQLLAFSRTKPVTPRVLNINAVVGDMQRMLERLVGEHINVSTSLGADLWNVRVDPGSLEQVIANLSVNARDAMPSGGRLTIETANVELDDHYAVAHEAEVPPGRYVVLAISDDGVGMDEATQRQIFEPFFTTKGAGKGTGLGLSTCYGIVKQAGGHIWVYSEVGSGTSFKVYFPCVLDEAEDAAVPASSPSAVVGGSEAILVVEDDARVRGIVVRILARLGYDVIAVAGGAEALEECEKDIPIDLLLTDMVMPEMSGAELAERASSIRPGLKVVYMSGYTPDALRHRRVLVTGAHMLQKPLTPDQLGRKVREVLDE